MRPEDVAYWKE